MPSFPALTDPTITIIFATSPTGLGHLRVTEALYRGLPRTASPVLLGAQDESVSAGYRFVSINPFTRSIMEGLQSPPFDTFLAALGTKLIRSQTKLLYQQLKTIVSERLIVPKTVLLVAPHTILGHQLGSIKEKLAREMGVTILLVVQITDDSPQPISYIYDADLIVVPSVYTREKLLAYAKSAQLPQVPVLVAAYPISPSFAEALSEHAFAQKLEQVNPEAASDVHMTVPVSGAAVGTWFSSMYIESMHQLSKRFVFHVVSREAGYTKSFIQTMSGLGYVKLHTSTHDRTTVDNYEHVFKEEPIALEITKPSEQAFKALATPRQRGGVIMLLATPVGGQEYDNLHFLRNHNLMPGKHETKQLWQLAAEDGKAHDTDFLLKARHWRALRLPDDPIAASAFTLWCLREKVFAAMMHYTRALQTEELQSNGVEQFWGAVEKLVEEQTK